jgi:competence ComEA-like helix-hairpin-helix protein
MLSLTTEERKVLVFLLGVALMGVGVSYAAKVFAPVERIARLESDFGKVDLNSADKDTLKSVPGIGEKLAGRIIAFREEKAGLSDIEQIKEIKGFTSGKFNKMKNYIMVR